MRAVLVGGRRGAVVGVVRGAAVVGGILGGVAEEEGQGVDGLGIGRGGVAVGGVGVVGAIR
ncbi:hypothetical protein [Clavibacter zhangzhiyongii]|uniref:hypothetical protein n=1 Tax=Clavibacter zhangzhiyongii TaxID=2768071 RepID=UPI0039E09712